MSPSRRDVLRTGAVSVASALATLSVAGCRAPAATSPTFAPPLGITGGLDRAAAGAAAGLDFLEPGVTSHLRPDLGDADFAGRRDALRASPLPPRAANGFLPGRLRCTGPDADHDGVLAWCEVAFPRARSVGIEVITFGSSAARNLPEGWPRADGEQQLTGLLARMGPRAADHGVLVGLEPLQVSESNLLNRLADCDRVAHAVDHPAVGLTADVFHMLRAGEGPEAIRAARARIVHVHLAEVGERTAPGVAGDDLTGYLAALRDVGYAGGISLECRWGDVAAEVGPATRALRGQLRGAGG